MRLRSRPGPSSGARGARSASARAGALAVSAAWLAAALSPTGCGGSAPLRASAPSAPTELARCKVAASQDNPLVTEWPASEKANLESRLRHGGVAVAYAGCSMRLLPQCPVDGEYTWRRTTIATDLIEIRDADELYTKLPLGAVSLEGELQRSGRIAVQTTVAGQLELRDFVPTQVATDGACEEATHVVAALSVGTFKLRSGGALMARSGAAGPGIGEASGGTRSEEAVMRQAGDPESCKDATDDVPSVECRSPIQVFLSPLPKADRAPAGTVKASFVSGDSSRIWEVLGTTQCKRTPCTEFIDPNLTYGMRSDAGPVKGNDQLEVPDLRPYAGEGPIQVKAEGRSFAAFSGGVVMTTFGGLGTASGIALLAAGCAMGDDDLCISGAITLPLSAALLLVPGIWLTVESGAAVKVTGAGTAAATRRAPPARLEVGGVF